MRLLRGRTDQAAPAPHLVVSAAAVLASLAFAWQGGKMPAPRPNRRPRPSGRRRAPISPCRPGPLCNQAIGVQARIDTYHRQLAAARPRRATTAGPATLPLEQPLAAGKLALGFMASLGGALLIFLLAAGHVGDEWDHRTIKTLLCQEGRRGGCWPPRSPACGWRLSPSWLWTGSCWLGPA